MNLPHVRHCVFSKTHESPVQCVTRCQPNFTYKHFTSFYCVPHSPCWTVSTSKQRCRSIRLERRQADHPRSQRQCGQWCLSKSLGTIGQGTWIPACREIQTSTACLLCKACRILHNIASFVTSKPEHGGIVYDSVVVLMRICQSQNPWQVQVSGSCLNSKPGLDSPIFIKLYTDFRIKETMQDHRQCQFKFPVPQINAKNGEKGNTFTMHVFNGSTTSTIQELHRTHAQAPPKGLVLGLQFPQKSESSFVSIGDPRLNRLLCQ